jgi:hypothetical protein
VVVVQYVMGCDGIVEVMDVESRGCSNFDMNTTYAAVNRDGAHCIL